MSDAVDEKWFDYFNEIRVRYDKLVTPDPFSFNANQELDDKSFDFSYSHLKGADFSQIKNKINNLRSLIDAEQTDSYPAYVLWSRKLDEVESQVELLSAIRSYLHETNKCTYREVQDLMHRVICNPEKNILRLTLAELLDRLRLKGSIEVLAQLGIEKDLVGDDYGSIVKDYPFVYLPHKEINNRNQVSIDDLRASFEVELKNKGLDSIWKVKIDESGKYKRVSVFYRNKIIMLPSRYLDIGRINKNTVSQKKLVRLIAHEIHTHVERSSNGLKSRLKLLSVGLDKYVSAEEGLATFREQRALGSGKYFAGFYPYLSVCLALGLDRDGYTRTPYELYKILKAIFMELDYKDESKASYAAMKRVMRTYIGFKDKYLINTKDLNYREGNMKIHKFIYESESGDDVLDVGIYDPTNVIHVENLKELGILK